MRISSNYITRPYSQYPNRQIKPEITHENPLQVNFGKSFVPKFLKRMIVPKNVKENCAKKCERKCEIALLSG